MKFIRPVSDLHLDFDITSYGKTRLYDPHDPKSVEHFKQLRVHGEMGTLWFPEPMEGDDDTTLVIAGDIWLERRFIERKFADGESWLEKIAKQFKFVVFVLGNHDYWSQHLINEGPRIKEILEGKTKHSPKIENAFILDKTEIVLDQVKFLGGTLWTDMNRCDPRVEMQGTGIMQHDYHSIRTGRAGQYRRCRPMDTYEQHMNTKKFIFNNSYRDDLAQKVCVVSHMAPSYESIDPKFRNGEHVAANHFYYTDLVERIYADGGDIDWWIHGHIHYPSDYYINNVRVICNPRGYWGEGIKFDPYFRLEV